MIYFFYPNKKNYKIRQNFLTKIDILVIIKNGSDKQGKDLEFENDNK